MNKKFKHLITALVLIIVATGVFYGVKSKLDIGKEKQIKVNPIQNYKNTDAYVEQNINSFFQIYSNMVNSQTLDISYLSDVVDKNSNAYKTIENEINQLRKNSVQLQIAVTEMKITQKADNLYEANVTIDKIITAGKDIDSSPTSKLSITIKSQDGYKITEYEKNNQLK